MIMQEIKGYLEFSEYLNKGEYHRQPAGPIVFQYNEDGTIKDEDYWKMLGLLHDVDWGITKNNSVEHLTKAPEILKSAGFDDKFICIVVSHGYGFECAGLKDKKREEKIEHALAASETLTGLIHAYGLMRKSLEGMEVSGLKKKMKNKQFAAAISRDIIMECEQTGLTLDEFLDIAIKAVQSIAKDVGF